MSDPSFPCTLTIHTPFPSPRLAHIALRALSVDKELSPLVRRTLSLVHTVPSTTPLTTQLQPSSPPPASSEAQEGEDSPPDSALQGDETILRARYAATTNRMLRVAVNGFFESLGVVLVAMRELDAGVADAEWRGDDALVSGSNGSAAGGLSTGGEAEWAGPLRRLDKVQGLEERGAVG